MRLIDADALLKKIEDDAEFYLVGDDENSKAVGSALLDVMEQINAMPTIEPDWNELLVICDNCGHAIRFKRVEDE